VRKYLIFYGTLDYKTLPCLKLFGWAIQPTSRFLDMLSEEVDSQTPPTHKQPVSQSNLPEAS